MEECGVISVATEFMVGSRFGSRYDGGARVLLIAARVHLPTDLSGLLPKLATANQQLICGVRQRK